MTIVRRLALACAALCAAAVPALAEVSELRITRQPSIVYLPLIVMEQQKLVEKHAAAAGLPDVKATWITFTSGGTSTEALLSGSVDLVTSGVSNLLLLWERTKGEVKGVAGASAISMVLVTRNPNVKTLKDFTEKDRIAVPTLKVSMQATVLKMAAEQAFGLEGRDKLDPLTVQLGHPDATAAILNASHEVNSHFSLPPYVNMALADPRIHKVLDSEQVVGGPISNGVVFGTRKFHDANPRVMKAFVAGLEEAAALIRTDPKRAAEIYIEATREKIALDDLTAMIKEPGNVFSTRPYNTMKVAELFVRAGIMKQAPKTWQDFFFSELHDGPGT